jgi:hypothetical protein
VDGIRLHAWYAPAPGPAPVLVWSHGNGGNIGWRAQALSALAAEGLAVLAYDYRGYGRSGGRPTEDGVSLDAEAAWESLRADGVAPTRIVAFGESLGGAIAIRLATARPCAAVAVVSTFTTIRAVARHHFGPLAAFAGQRFDTLTRLRTLAVPLLVAHGDRDEVVPYALGEALFAAATVPKRFVRVAGAGHNDVFDAPTLIRAIAAFAHEVAGARDGRRVKNAAYGSRGAGHPQRRL